MRSKLECVDIPTQKEKSKKKKAKTVVEAKLEEVVPILEITQTSHLPDLLSETTPVTNSWVQPQVSQPIQPFSEETHFSWCMNCSDFCSFKGSQCNKCNPYPSLPEFTFGDQFSFVNYSSSFSTSEIFKEDSFSELSNLFF